MPPEDVQRQLRRILSSDVFKGSRRCVVFLEYVVNQRLAGAADNLREKVIGVEAFGRSAGYDSNDDPVVRVTAGEVRKRLAQYYLEPGHASELRIELVAGSYVPEFQPSSPAQTPVPVPDVPLAGPSTRPSRRWWWGLALFGTLTLLAWRAGWIGPPSPFERFWAPTLTTPGPILLSVGQSRVYSLRKELALRVEAALDQDQTGQPARTIPDSQTVTAQDLIPAWERYVPIGDAVSISNMAIFLDHRRREYRIRGSSATRLTDLREGATILFGAFSNDWTLRMNKNLRFYQDLLPDGHRYLLDREHPERREWKGTPVDRPSASEYADYAILNRIFDRTSGHPVISIGGITHLATQAGGEFVLSPTLMNEALAKAPAGWEAKNLQMVIATKVIGSSASPPQILALHVW